MWPPPFLGSSGLVKDHQKVCQVQLSISRVEVCIPTRIAASPAAIFRPVGMPPLPSGLTGKDVPTGGSGVPAGGPERATFPRVATSSAVRLRVWNRSSETTGRPWWSNEFGSTPGGTTHISDDHVFDPGVFGVPLAAGPAQ